MARFDERAALVVVDVQNDFADAKGSLAVPGAEQALVTVNAAVEMARDGGALVVYTQDWHPPSTPHFAKDGGVWPEHCVAGTWGAELHPALVVVPGAPVVRKGVGGEDGYSGFTVRDPESGAQDRTELEALLRARGVERIVVAGLATDYCVKETALDALRLGFETVVLRDGIAAVNLEPDDGESAIETMRHAGAFID